jgi:flagellum-specific peptidoglycan hydrolase FlgJ
MLNQTSPEDEQSDQDKEIQLLRKNLPEEYNWITHKSIPKETQLDLLNSYSSGNIEDFNEKYSTLKSEKLSEFGSVALDVAGNAALAISGGGIAGAGVKAGISGLSKIFTGNSIKQAASTGISKISNLFSSGTKQVKNLKYKDYATKERQDFIKEQSKTGKTNPFKKSTETKENISNKSSKQNTRNLFKPKFGPKTQKNTNTTQTKNTNTKKSGIFRKLAIPGLVAGAALDPAGLMGAALGTYVGDPNGTGSLLPAGNSIENTLNSMPSGGDTGTTGEGHFGGDGIGGKTVLEVLNKIYSLLMRTYDATEQVVKNTANFVRGAAQQDAARDILSANANARQNEGGGGGTASAVFGSDVGGVSGNTTDDGETASKSVFNFLKKVLPVAALAALYPDNAEAQDALNEQNQSDTTSRIISDLFSNKNNSIFNSGESVVDSVVKDPSKKQKEHYNKVYNLSLSEATKRGYKNPEVQAGLAASQSVLETGSGAHRPAENALFGIKYNKIGEGTSAPSNYVDTQEMSPSGGMQTIKAQFRGYKSEEDAVKDRFDFLEKNQRYKNVLTATTNKEAAEAIQQSGYATDQGYGQKVYNIIKQNTQSKGFSSLAPTKENAEKLQAAEQKMNQPVSTNIETKEKLTTNTYTETKEKPTAIPLQTKTNGRKINKGYIGSQISTDDTGWMNPQVETTPRPSVEQQLNNLNTLAPSPQIIQAPAAAPAAPTSSAGHGGSIPVVRNEDPTLKRLEEGNVWSTNSSNS